MKPTMTKLRRGTTLHNGDYKVIDWTDKKYVVERVKTGSTVTVTKAMVEKTIARLTKGEKIPFRSISYTSAIECVVVNLIDGIEKDTANKVYKRSK